MSSAAPVRVTRSSAPLPSSGRRVNSQDTVSDWRRTGAISEGASVAVMMSCLLSAPKTPRTSVVISENRSYVCALIEDLTWAVSELQRMDATMDDLHFEDDDESEDSANDEDEPEERQAIPDNIEISDIGSAASAAPKFVPAAELTVKQVEQWAIFLHEALTHDTRLFHGLAHVFKISAGASPIQLLAAFFRDIISHFIDGMVLSAREKELLQNVFVDSNSFVLRPDFAQDPRDACVAHIFGYVPGTDLAPFRAPLEGLDIFLSAILASRLLQDFLSISRMAQIAACLEGTIPFRKPVAGKTRLDILYDRLKGCNKLFGTLLSERQIVETVQQAADLHNRCVGNMSSSDLAEFLDHSWRLLPEIHGSLRQHALYTLTDYYKAIQGMVTMTQRLDPSVVYVSFRDMPTVNEIGGFQQKLKKNLKTSKYYLEARLLSVAIVSALACLTGGDGAPKSFFFGDLPSFHRYTTILGEGLISIKNDDDPSDMVFHLLLTGDRMSETNFDAKNALLAAYLYRELGVEAISRALTKCQVPMTKAAARTLLGGLPLSVVEQVAKELGRVAITRKKGIEIFLEDLRGQDWRFL